MTQAVDDLAIANQRLMKKLLVVAAIMFGFGFALVPFYERLCELAGIRDVFRPDTIAAQDMRVDANRQVTIEFDANTRRLPWTFKPLQASVSVHPGELAQVVYEVENTLDRPITGQAVPSYSPQQAAAYFGKMECFCFRQQTLAPGEVRRMPVVFMIDPKLPPELTTVRGGG